MTESQLGVTSSRAAAADSVSLPSHDITDMIELLSNLLIYFLIGRRRGSGLHSMIKLEYTPSPPHLLTLIFPVSGLTTPSVPLVSGCEQVKFYYQHGTFDSSYVLKDVDSTVMDDGCVDGCVYMK